jgi:hypothetical protein
MPPSSCGAHLVLIIWLFVLCLIYQRIGLTRFGRWRKWFSLDSGYFFSCIATTCSINAILPRSWGGLAGFLIFGHIVFSYNYVKSSTGAVGAIRFTTMIAASLAAVEL